MGAVHPYSPAHASQRADGISLSERSRKRPSGRTWAIPRCGGSCDRRCSARQHTQVPTLDLTGGDERGFPDLDPVPPVRGATVVFPQTGAGALVVLGTLTSSVAPLGGPEVHHDVDVAEPAGQPVDQVLQVGPGECPHAFALMFGPDQLTQVVMKPAAIAATVIGHFCQHAPADRPIYTGQGVAIRRVAIHALTVITLRHPAPMRSAFGASSSGPEARKVPSVVGCDSWRPDWAPRAGISAAYRWPPSSGLANYARTGQLRPDRTSSAYHILA